MDESLRDSDTMWGGLPRKRYGETFGDYLRRITPEQESLMSLKGRAIGVLPRSIFDSYLPVERERTDESK